MGSTWNDLDDWALRVQKLWALASRAAKTSVEASQGTNQSGGRPLWPNPSAVESDELTSADDVGVIRASNAVTDTRPSAECRLWRDNAGACRKS